MAKCLHILGPPYRYSAPGVPSFSNAIPLLRFLVALDTSSAVIGVSSGRAAPVHNSIGSLHVFILKLVVDDFYRWY